MDEKLTKVLFLSYDGMTDPLGQSQVLPYIQGLSKQGFQFTLVSFEKEVRFKKHRAQIERIAAENNIDWQPLSYLDKPGVLAPLMNVIRLRKKCRELQQKSSFDIVHSRSHLTSFAALMLKRKFGVKYVFDMRGFWADERVDGGLWNLKNPLFSFIFHFFKRKEKEFLREADQVVSLTEAGKREMLKWNVEALDERKISVIPCCTDLNLFSPKGISDNEKKAIKKKLGIAQDNFVLSYLGSIGTWYMLSEMLDFFRVLKSKNAAAKFLFITNEAPLFIKSSAVKKGIAEQDIVVVNASRNDVPLYLSLSDYSLFFIKPAYSKKASSPTKQGEIMAMGIPCVTNTGVGDSDDIVSKCNAGLLVNEFLEREYERVAELMTEKAFSAEDIRSEAHAAFSLERGVKQFKAVYLKALGK